MSRSVLVLLQRPPKTLDILVYLLDKEEVKVSEMRDELGIARSTCHAAVKSLERLGLIFLKPVTVRRKQDYVGLTIEGREIAEGLSPISNKLKSTISGLGSELDALEMKERMEAENRRMLEILLVLTEAKFTLGQWDDVESYGKRAFDIASALNDKASAAEALQRLGELHFGKGMMDVAEKEFSQSLLIRKRTGDAGGASGNHYFLGAVREKRGDLQGALKDYEEAERLAGVSEDEVLQARANLGIGRVLAREGKYRDSLGKFKESVEVLERMEELDELPRAYTCVGSSMFYTDVDDAIKWHQKCIDLSRKIGDLRMLCQGLSNMAGCYNKKKESKKALQHLKEAEKISKMFDEKDMLVGINIHFGWTFSLEGRWIEAESRFLQAIDIARKHGFTYELGNALLNFGLMNIDRGRTQEAKRQLKEALEIFERLNNQQRINSVREALSKINR